MVVDESRLFADVMEAIEIAVYVWELEDVDDPAGMRLIYANPTTAVVTGVPTEQLVGRTMRESFPRSDEHARLGVYREVALGGAARDLGDVVYEDARVGRRTFAVRIFPLPNRRVGVACHDVTGQRVAEAGALEVMESMSDAFYSFDREWRYTFINAEGEKVAQRTRDELLGRTIWEVYPAAVGLKLHDAFQRAAQERVTVVAEEHFALFGTWVSVRVYPTRDGIAVYAQDITARKKLEEQVRQSHKMEAVSTLAGGMAHDFNNALTAIRAAAGLALAELDDGPARADVQRIDDVAGHAAALTEQLLTISRSQALRVEPTALHEALRDAAELVADLVGPQVTVTTAFDATSDTVLMDRARLQQVVLNLSLNARDAMPDGGTLQLRTSDVVVDEGSAADGAQAGPGRYVALEVLDSGTGMDDETRARAFDPFFTTKPEGTGLGLASVYGIVTQSGGHVDLSSEVGVGTCFTILLRATDLPVGDRDAPSDVVAAAAPGATVLVVDDDDAIRPLVTRALERQGYRVLQASGGSEALAVASALDGPLDLLLTDVVMPGMGGGELAARLRSERPDVRVVFMSGHAVDTLVQRGVQDATATFLQKPFRLAALADTVRAALDAPQPSARG